MNRFTRNNLLLITVIACSCVAAIGLLIFSIIRYVDMSHCMDEIENIKKQVKTLAAKNPSPHKDNREPIQANTRIMEAGARDLEKNFRSPMTDLAEKFVAMLEETNPPKEDDKIVPLTVERFRSAYNDMWGSGQNYVAKGYNYKDFRELKFKNWNKVVRQLLPEAQKLTTEPLTEAKLPEVLMSYIGINRDMGEQPENMVRYMKDYQNVLIKKLTNIKVNVEDNRIDWFGFDADPTPGIVAARFNNPREQYHQVCRVWDIYGDVIDRMSKCNKKLIYTRKDGKKVVVEHSTDEENRLKDHNIKFTEIDDRIENFYGIALRAAMAPLNAKDGGGNSEDGGLRNAINGNDEGPFKLYRLRVTVGGTMAGIRTFIRTLDEAYKDKRVYVVKSVALYAERDGAQEIFRSRDEQAGISSGVKKAPAEPQNVGRGRGRGRGRAVMHDEPEQQVQTKIDPAVIEEMRRQQEEANKKLKFYERIGYGDVLIGDDRSCKAVIDFDYYELKYEAK